MADVSIKNLPEASQINLNDFLIVEGETGTNILKFSNFIIGQENTSFQPLLSSHTNSINFNRTLLANLSSTTLTLSSYFESTSRGVALGGDVLHTLSGVGIGTTDVAEKLTVLGNISASGSLSAIGSDYNYLGNRLGVGTTAPSHLIHIHGDGANGELALERSSGTKMLFQAQASLGRLGTTTNDKLQFTTNDTGRLTIDTSGRIGIGTSSPHTTLHIGGSGSFSMAEATEHPVDPAANTEAFFYIKADKFIIKFNDSGTVRYKYMVLSGDHVTWVQTLTSP